jgi:hypothetical protein
MENNTTTEIKIFHNFVERLIRFDDWARQNKIKFLKKNNPKLLEQLIKDNQI